jgi:two-component system sensor kinase FixL
MHLAVSQLALGDELLFAGIVRDITDLKQAQLDLARANERLEQRVQERTSELESTQAELLKTERLATLGQVSGGIAHEIRNPLNAVRTSVYFLRHARQLSSEKVAEHLERIDRQVSLIDNVVTALSDIARLPEPKLAPCDVNGIVREALASISLPESIDVQVALPDEPLLAAIDPNQISIVLRNLIRNARDAMAEGGTITLSAREDGEQVIVKVTDTGTGIPEEELKRITEPLYSTKARGMGLGLAISVAILQKNQGRLEVSSQVGQGTEFSIRLHRSCEGYD